MVVAVAAVGVMVSFGASVLATKMIAKQDLEKASAEA